MRFTFRPSSIVVVLVALAATVPAQVQTNSPEASLLVNGASGTVTVPQGGVIDCLVQGAPNSVVVPWRW